MEHGLILLIEAILAIDRQLQKPLRAVVADLPRLRADPAGYLTAEEVVIGPRRPYAVATVLGLLAGIAVFVSFAISAFDNPRNRVGPGDALAAGLAVLVTFAASTALILQWLRGGAAVLGRQGVALIYRGRTVFCPWNLFHTPGLPYQPDHKRVILPVNDVTPIALADGDEAVDARPVGEVKTRQFQGSAEGQAALADLYEVKLPELGELLLHLGRHLGDGPVIEVDAEDDGTAGVPLATVDEGDWLRIRLTRLPFPPVCTACGVYTRDTIQHPLDATHNVLIDLPVCRSCQDERSRRRRRALWVGLAVGSLPALAWVMATAPFLGGIDVCLGFGLLLPVGLGVGLVAGLIARDRADPVRFKDYSVASGTVAMWLRPSAGRSAFRSVLGVDETADNAPTD